MKVAINNNAPLEFEPSKYAEVDLPASPSMLIDALDRAKVPPPGGGGYTLECCGGLPLFLCNFMEDIEESPSLMECNRLGERLRGMSEYDLNKLEAVLVHREAATLTDAVNAAYNLDRFSLMPGLRTLEDLGDHVLYNILWTHSLLFSVLKRRIEMNPERDVDGTSLFWIDPNIGASSPMFLPD